jgi:ATP-dependent Clp protease ATP-binding subunit ClpC
MTIPLSRDLQSITSRARDVARRSGGPLTSGHLLVALFSSESTAQELLADANISENSVLERLPRAGDEAAGTGERLLAKAVELAAGCGSREVAPLHLLVALCSGGERDIPTQSYRILDGLNANPKNIRLNALGAITNPGRARRSQSPTPTPAPAATERPAVAPRVSGFTPQPAPVPAPASPAPVTPRAAEPASAQNQNPQLPPAPEVPVEEIDPEELNSPFALDRRKFPMLSTLGRNLTRLSELGKLDPLIGREREIEQIIDILGKRRANNPLLVGEPGVGKTAIVEGLAQKMILEQSGPLQGKLLIEIELGNLLAGTQMRGSLQERLAALKEEVKRAEGNIIVYLDAVHSLVGAGQAGDGGQDTASELRAAMMRGEFPCIGTTSRDEYKKLESNPTFERVFAAVHVEEPSEEEAIGVLKGISSRFASYHKIHYTDDAIESSVRQAARYITERSLPDKAVGLIDLAGSRARREGKEEVTRAEIARIVSRIARIPEERLLLSDKERLLNMEDHLAAGIVGHRDILVRVAQVIRRNYAGFSADRPIGSFLFLGPTGVGKTETVKVLASFLFQQEEAMTRLDMSEYREPHTVARLIGAPPGYVGYDEGGQLTEAIRRRPYQIVLLDEIEKAHRDVWQVLLQILDEGRLTDGKGRTVDFTHTVVVMTSNLGSQHYARDARNIGFSSADDKKGAQDLKDKVLGTAKEAFPIELWNRIEERLVFDPLNQEQVSSITTLLAAKSSARLEKERGIRYELSPEAIVYLIEHGGFDVKLGARPMRNTIQRLVEGPIAEQILQNRLTRGDVAVVSVVDGKLEIGKRV